MKKAKSMVLIFLMLLLIAAGCSKGPSGSSKASSNSNSNALRMATLSQGGAWYVYGATISELLNKKVKDIERVDVLPYAGGLGNVQILDKGEAELALTFSLNNRWAVDGTFGYKKKYSNLRVLAGGFDEYYVGIIMTNKFMDKYGITSIADIKEKKVPVKLLTLNKGSQGEYAAIQVLEAYGLDYDRIKSFGGSVEHTTFDVVKSSIQDGKADMFIQVMTKGHPTFTEIALQTPVTFIPVEDEYLDKLKKFGYSKAILPPKVFHGQDKEVQALGLTTTLVTTTDLSDKMAYEITKAIAENKETLVKGHQSLSVYDPEKGITADATGGIPLHPGAEKYYKEKGWIK
ncbi:TAXI family TRAP transporter solute-binding subunit [Neobacillus mesonae]|uniref:TAXI family TRAP transporter solute-binding subunit n=1 Tax=Neobacillus mesonae TaxID=1193713 RepID=UPI00203DAF7D|nr:TAXI family TRAP transporter solute-binding subunit [Neobacillus mesonae]MCM3568454.1 TAXI family TRAP transporter solute-binding subunit [Neobacillus mesonae]